MSLKDFLESDSDITVLIKYDSPSLGEIALDVYETLQDSSNVNKRMLVLSDNFHELKHWSNELVEGLDNAKVDQRLSLEVTGSGSCNWWEKPEDMDVIRGLLLDNAYIHKLEDYTTEDFLIVLSRCKPEGKLKATLTKREADQFEFYRLWKDSGIKSNKCFLKVTEQGVIVSEEGDVSISFITL